MHRGQLDRQGKPIQLFADGRHLAHCVLSSWTASLCSLTKERHRVFEHEWSKPEFLLGTQA